jgi:hypothetical protein
VDTELLFSGYDLAGMLVKVLTGSDFECTSSGNNALVVNGVGDSSETVLDGISGLGNGVIVGALDQDGAGEGVLNTFDESVFVFTELLFVNNLGETHIGLFQVVDGVEELTSAGERDSFTVSLLGAADTDNASAGEDLEGGGINTLLVNDDKVLVGAVAKLLLELNDLVDLLVGEGALGGDELLSLVSIGPEESGVNFGLFVLKRDVQAHDVAVLKS